ncbi:MAG: cytochrome c [Gammaproteobacteria bacterium]|nr:cytochrome c [Gammaproteobacteria bacterium]MDH4253184.1 cytochrome c [Gammaproteobacteria bacterium]MDH5308454.1 cytochrome c [Gammaproteobacteria bacterium]
MRVATRIMQSTITLAGAVAVLGALDRAVAADYFNGREVYELHCQSCHGFDGRSMDPGTPDFTRGESLFVPDSDLYRQIRDGVGAMPAYRGLIEDNEILDVIAYVRSLQQ